MDQFPDWHHVRLRSRALGGYLHAADDGESVLLRRSRASMNSAWAVHLRPNGDRGRGVHLLLHSAAYGRYLASTAAPAPPGHRGSRAEQRNYDHPVVQDIMWEAVRAGSQGDVLLRTVGGLYLRANGRYRRWNAGVSVDGDYVSTMARWAVERIPLRDGAPVLPPPIPVSSLARLPGRLSELIFGRPEPGVWRIIRFFTENGFNEGYPENGWNAFPFFGRSVFQLSEELDIHVGVLNGRPAPRLRHAVPAFGEADLPDGFVMCVRAGRHGRLIPLVVDLPRGGDGETLDIIVALSGTQVYHELRHPDVDAA